MAIYISYCPFLPSSSPLVISDGILVIFHSFSVYPFEVNIIWQPFWPGHTNRFSYQPSIETKRTWWFAQKWLTHFLALPVSQGREKVKEGKKKFGRCFHFIDCRNIAYRIPIKIIILSQSRLCLSPGKKYVSLRLCLSILCHLQVEHFNEGARGKK